MMRQRKALAILKAGKNVFLTGSAGAGKTYVLNQYIEYLKSRKIAVAITASTGIAATHMNGMTIHSWAGIGVKDTLSQADLEFMKQKKYLRDKLEAVQVLIIDEISMLHKQQLELVNMVLRFFKKNSLAFGGVQVVFCGDFFQLPPIGRQGEDNREKFAFMSNAWLDAAPVICYIDEQHRQAENTLSVILNEIRQGNAGQSTFDTLTGSIGRTAPDPANITRLFTHNVDVDRINSEHLLSLKTESRVFKATIKGNDKLRDLLVKSVLTDALLELRIGTRVMFIKNNYEKGYMNGTLGELIDFSDEGFPLVKTHNGQMIEAEPEDWSIQDEKGKALASFSQVPLRLAWAITVHKSQGMTLDEAEVDLSKTFERGQGYVALSRLRDLEHLYLSGFNSMALQVDPLALKADKRFRELSEEADKRWSEEELEKYAEAFVIVSGGLTDEMAIAKHSNKRKAKKEKKSTYEITEELILQGYSMKDIATERGISEGSIITHLIKLKEIRPELDLERFRPDQALIERVSEAIKLLGPAIYGEKGQMIFTPIFNHFQGEFTYNELKLASLYI